MQHNMDELQKSTHEKLRKQKLYIEELLNMNELLQKECTILKGQHADSDHKSAEIIEKLTQELKDLSTQRVKQTEKVFAQVLQLGSVASHLKDLVKLSHIEKEPKKNQDLIYEYIEMNFENTVK